MNKRKYSFYLLYFVFSCIYGLELAFFLKGLEQGILFLLFKELVHLDRILRWLIIRNFCHIKQLKFYTKNNILSIYLFCFLLITDPKELNNYNNINRH